MFTKLVLVSLLTSGALSQTTTLDLFCPYDRFPLEDQGFATVIAQDATTTQFQLICTGWYKLNACHKEGTLIVGPSTYSMVIPNYSGLYESGECTMSCGTATCTELFAVAGATSVGTPHTTTFTGLASLYTPFTITGALPTPGAATSDTCNQVAAHSITSMASQTSQTSQLSQTSMFSRSSMSTQASLRSQTSQATAAISAVAEISQTRRTSPGTSSTTATKASTGSISEVKVGNGLIFIAVFIGGWLLA